MYLYSKYKQYLRKNRSRCANQSNFQYYVAVNYHSIIMSYLKKQASPCHFTVRASADEIVAVLSGQANPIGQEEPRRQAAETNPEQGGNQGLESLSGNI